MSTPSKVPAQEEDALPLRTPHALPVSDILHHLDSSTQGLDSSQAATLLSSLGPNELRRAAPETMLQRLFRQINDPMIYVLIAAAILTAILRNWTDTIVISAVVIVNMMVGFIQEGKAADALASIKEMLSPESTALRDGEWTTIDAAELVPGDIVRISAGDRIPADLRIITATNLQVEEAALTGESEPVLKHPDPVEDYAGIGDRTCMAFSSTTALTGTGTGVVTATGHDTEIGHITTMLEDVESVDTPLTRAMTKFSSTLAIACVVLAILMLVVSGIVHGTPMEQLIMSAIGFAVAAIPEGLPAVIAITLALGVQKMAGRKAITRQLNSVETLGSVTTVCSDKTGTLTKNEMTVRSLVTLEGFYDVSGSGYEPVGTISLTNTGEEIDPAQRPDVHALGEVAANVCDAEIREVDGRWQLIGEPTDGGIRTFALKTGVEPMPRQAEIPFDSSYKYMATLHETAGENLLLVKGAPDRLLDRSSHQGNGQPLDREYWDKRIDALGSRGLRVLAAARRTLPTLVDDPTTATVDEGGLTFLGLYGIMDPPRTEVIGAIDTVQKAGVRVRMITGDHASTAKAIAREVGIKGDRVLTGQQITDASDEDLRELVQDTGIFVRTSPEHKLRIVQALQANGEVVSMTGDGVNDAPSLKQADVGVAMGIKGTEATKDAADIVLADDNFATIARAMEMGRTIYDNLRKAIVFMLPTNGAQGLVIFVAMMFGWQLPITPLQVLWVNLITAITLSLALSFEPAEPDIMKRRPRDPNANILDREAFVRIVYVSLLLGAMTFWAFSLSLDNGATLEQARTIAVNSLAVGQVFYLLVTRFFRVRTLRKELFTRNPISWLCIGIMMVLQLGFAYLPFMNATFDTAPVSLESWLLPLTAGVTIFVVVELEKLMRRQTSHDEVVV